VGAFRKVLSMAYRAFEEAHSVKVNPGLDLDRRLESLVMTGACLSSREERVVL